MKIKMDTKTKVGTKIAVAIALVSVAGILAVALSAIVSSGAPKVTVSTPNGGEKVVIGKKTKLSWTKENIVKDTGIRIKLISENKSESLIFDQASGFNNSYYDWTPAETTVPGKYKIKIVFYSKSAKGETEKTSDLSNDWFKVEKQCSSSATYPAGNEWMSDPKPNIGDTSTAIIRYNGKYYAYYGDSSSGDIVMATSSDGFDFGNKKTILTAQKENNPEITEIHDPTIVNLNGKNLTMFYTCGKKLDSGKHVYNLCAALSSDGEQWTQVGIVQKPNANDYGSVSLPEALIFPDNKLRVYYIADFERGPDSCECVKLLVFSGNVGSAAELKDGSKWKRESLSGLPQHARDVDVVFNSSSSYRLFFTGSGDSGYSLDESGTYSAISSNGKDWTIEKCPIMRTTKGKTDPSDPDVMRLPNGKFRMYYGVGTAKAGGGGENYTLYSATSQ